MNPSRFPLIVVQKADRSRSFRELDRIFQEDFMSLVSAKPVHPFHIPVLGTGFSIDSPLKVARFGISSVLSLVDDQLIEEMREFHSLKREEAYTPIRDDEKDFRARRITAYLDCLDRWINQDLLDMKETPLNPEEDNGRYFEMLPESPLKELYQRWLEMSEGEEKDNLEIKLKEAMSPGSIDVNIMTKLDRETDGVSGEEGAYYSDATTALRGFACSSLRSSIVFSAGMNPRLFSTLMEYGDFRPDQHGDISKKIVLKVSDYRSALIQGQMLAKKGLWVSEFRIESGLNCGGHAFATKGSLIGPILQEFLDKREELKTRLEEAFLKALPAQEIVPVIRISVQGGVGTSEEDRFLREHYKMDSIGWGTPFMLVPEAVNLDEEHLEKLAHAGPEDVFLSNASPLGVLFWNLKNSASETLRRFRIGEGKPGAPCRKGFLALNNEVTEKPVCAASRTYQKLKLAALDMENHPKALLQKMKEKIMDRACICYDLAVSITKKIGKDPSGSTAVTPGPNIVNFSRVSTLKDMLSHIYGKINLVTRKNRPHMFIRELELYLDFFRKELEEKRLGLNSQKKKYFGDFQKNLLAGVDYYAGLSKDFIKEKSEDFQSSLLVLKDRITGLTPQIESLD